MDHAVILSYNSIYSDQTTPDIDNLLKGFKKSYVLNLINFLNEYRDDLNTTLATINFLTEKWFSTGNIEILNIIIDKIQQNKVKHQQSEIIIFNPQSTLALIEKLLVFMLEYEEEQTQLSDVNVEINIMMVYLIINQESELTDNGINEIQEVFPKEYQFWLVLLRPFQYADLINRTNEQLIFIEIGKSILFFKLLSQDTKTSKILNSFLKKYGIEKWQDYLVAIFSLSINLLEIRRKVNTSKYLIEIDPEYPLYDACIKIIDDITVPPKEIKIVPDYLLLRNYPIIKTGENRFQVLYPRFLIEKIFKSLYFNLMEIGGDLKVMSRNDFRRFYTSEYSENKLSYYVLNNIFRRADLRIECNKIEKDNPQFGPIDYIAFSNKNFFLFESKDILIKKEVKQQMHLPEVRNELRTKFYNDGESDKALLQLAKNIKRIIDGKYSIYGVNSEKYKFIYPVVLVHSDSFNVFGFNQILRQWFKEACLEAGISKKESYKIKDVVIVDINTLVLYQDVLDTGKLGFGNIIDSYNAISNIHLLHKKGLRSSVEFQEKYCMPFSYYLENYIGNISKKRKYPENFQKELRYVVNEVSSLIK